MAKTSRKRKRAKARKGKAPASKGAKKPASKAARNAPTAARKQPGKGETATARKTAEKAKPKATAGKAAKPAASKEARASRKKKEPGTGIFSRLKRALTTSGKHARDAATPPRPAAARRWQDEPDLDRFAALDPANRTKTKLPPKIAQPSPLHLDSAPPRKTEISEPPQRIRLENPVLEPRRDGKLVRLNPDQEDADPEQAIKLTDAVIASTVSNTMARNPLTSIHDPFLVDLDEVPDSTPAKGRPGDDIPQGRNNSPSS